MKRLSLFYLLIILLIISGCSSIPATQQQQASQKQNQKLEGPLTFSKEFDIEHRTEPPLVDKSSDYITEEFEGIQGLEWNPLYFLDNDSFLFIATNLNYTEPWIFRYNLKTNKVDKLFPSEGGTGNLFIQDSDHFSMADNVAMISVDNNQVSKKIIFGSWKQKHKEYESYDAIANPRTGKVVLVNASISNHIKKCYLTDLNYEEILELSFTGVYRACWTDDNNLLLGAFDDVKTRQGSAVIAYNIQTKGTTKTYLGNDDYEFIPLRQSEGYCGFAYAGDYQDRGYSGIIDYAQNKIILLKFANTYEMNFQYHWLIALSTEQPIDWEAWGRTKDGTVRLGVYDIATNSYIIRDKALPRTAGMIISPDARTIVYKTFDKSYINREK